MMRDTGVLKVMHLSKIQNPATETQRGICDFAIGQFGNLKNQTDGAVPRFEFFWQSPSDLFCVLCATLG